MDDSGHSRDGGVISAPQRLHVVMFEDSVGPEEARRPETWGRSTKESQASYALSNGDVLAENQTRKLVGFSEVPVGNVRVSEVIFSAAGRLMCGLCASGVANGGAASRGGVLRRSCCPAPELLSGCVSTA